MRVRAVHLPGHTAGHCVLLVEPQGIAFIGDFASITTANERYLGFVDAMAADPSMA